mmetsp:Transcript_109851/g.218167  ORF Transcript_109851/g.218167 Transcript_109851/m.218167 type:complete len:235 (+) Transcript_109851:1253-1957(+)
MHGFKPQPCLPWSRLMPACSTPRKHKLGSKLPTSICAGWTRRSWISGKRTSRTPNTCCASLVAREPFKTPKRLPSSCSTVVFHRTVRQQALTRRWQQLAWRHALIVVLMVTLTWKLPSRTRDWKTPCGISQARADDYCRLHSAVQNSSLEALLLPHCELWACLMALTLWRTWKTGMSPALLQAKTVSLPCNNSPCQLSHLPRSQPMNSSRPTSAWRWSQRVVCCMIPLPACGVT